MNNKFRIGTAALVAVLFLSQGCAKRPPAIVSVSGTVTLNDLPLPHAEISFIPMEPGLDGNYIATAITDENGFYTLVLPAKPGAVVGVNKVTVTDGPLPDEARGQDGESQMIASRFLASLKNRPIPTSYGLASQTSLSVTVTPEQTEYNLTLKR